MDIDDVCEAIAAALTAAELDVNGQRLTATPFAPEALSPPHFFTAEFTGSYDKTFAGLAELALTCRLMLARSDDHTGQQQAKVMASTGVGTVNAAFLSMRGAPGQPALGGVCDDLHLTRVQGPRLYDIGGSFYGIEFNVFVMG